MGEQVLLKSEQKISNSTVDNTVPNIKSEDARKLIGSNISVTGCTTIDKKGRTAGHCDDNQIIPITSYLRYFGAIAENIKIIDCELDSDGSMQGIFFGDGGLRNSIIRNYTITTKSDHKVSLCGVLDNVEIMDVRDHKGNPARIFLDSFRIGGGASGNFYVASFKKGSKYQYGEVKTCQAIEDRRGEKWRDAEYVKDFDLDLFYKIAKKIKYPETGTALERVEQHLVKCRAEYDRLNNREVIIMENREKTKIAFIIGHNSKYQGKRRYETSEYKFWKLFINMALPKISQEGIELKVFERPPIKSYSEQMRQVHHEIDLWGGNISVELHFNASASTARGHEVLYSNGSKGGEIVNR